MELQGQVGSILGKHDFGAITNFTPQIRCVLQSVHISLFLLYCLNLFHFLTKHDTFDFCGDSKCVCILLLHIDKRLPSQFFVP